MASSCEERRGVGGWSRRPPEESRGRGGLGAGPRLGVTEREVLIMFIKSGGSARFISARSAPRGVSSFRSFHRESSTNILYRAVNYS